MVMIAKRRATARAARRPRRGGGGDGRRLNPAGKRSRNVMQNSVDLKFLTGGGDMARQIADTDWTAHPLGGIGGWTPACRTALSMVLNSGFPSYLLWGAQFFVFYNDAYLPILGDKAALGQGRTLRQLWHEIEQEACAIAQT